METLSVKIELKSILVIIVMMINVHIAIMSYKSCFHILTEAITHKALR